MSGVDRALADAGDWLLRHQQAIRWLQGGVIAAYGILLVLPAAMPLPGRSAHVWTNLVLFAQFAFWGVWWPFVLLSMVLVGRLWCGILCPEGALSEWTSGLGRGLAVPRWIRWKGWPFLAFACTTIYGQMVSVYQYALPALVVLGGSTVAAIAMGLVFGRGKRVWCRYLCPVNGVFTLLSKLAPVHFRVDPASWSAWPRAAGPQPSVNCAPLVAIKTMKGAGACHMCGRCSGYKGAIVLARRSPMHEIVHVAGSETRPWETVLIVVGLMGIAAGAFHWASSPVYVTVKQALAEGLVAADWMWPLEATLPWWLLTNVPDQNDVMTVLDGAVLVGFILGMAALVAAGTLGALAFAVRCLGPWSWARFHHLAQALIPMAGAGVFLGLSALTVTMLRAEGFDLAFVGPLRATLLGAAAAWSATFAWRIAGLGAVPATRRLSAMAAMAGAIGIGAASWATLFW